VLLDSVDTEGEGATSSAGGEDGGGSVEGEAGGAFRDGLLNGPSALEQRMPGL
jgi:hypothetical protein